MRRVLVVGVSALGAALVRALAGSLRLYAVDRLQWRVDALARLGGAEVACLDATDAAALRSFLPREPLDAAVVAIGGDFIAAEEVAEVLRGLVLPGRTPRPWVRRITVTANRPYRADILEALGHDVVTPVLDAGSSLAVQLAEEGLRSFRWLAPAADAEDSPFGVAELVVPGEGCEVSVEELRETFAALRILGVRERQRGPVISPTRSLPSGARLVVAGNAALLAQVAAALPGLARGGAVQDAPNEAPGSP